jgi:hypothetical protein
MRENAERTVLAKGIEAVRNAHRLAEGALRDDQIREAECKMFGGGGGQIGCRRQTFRTIFYETKEKARPRRLERSLVIFYERRQATTQEANQESLLIRPAPCALCCHLSVFFYKEVRIFRKNFRNCKSSIRQGGIQTDGVSLAHP